MSTDPEQPRDIHLGGVDRWATNVRGDEVADRRRRRWSLNAQADENASLSGALVDLGERGVRCSVSLCGEHRWAGVIAQVGADFFRLDTEHGPLLVRVDAVDHIRADPTSGSGRQRGEREVSTSLHFGEVLESLLQERAEVRIFTRHSGGGPSHGRLSLSGADLVAVDSAEGARTYVPLAAVAAVGLYEMP